MDLRVWKSFVALAETGHVGRAATRLALSQPALSARISGLEAELGYPLFERLPRGVRLTDRGTRLLPHAHQLLAQASHTLAASSAIRAGHLSRLHIGVTPLAVLGPAGDMLRQYVHAHPGVALALTEGSSHDLEEAVACTRLDVALVHPPSSRDDLSLHEITRDPMLAAVPEAHRLASMPAIAADQLHGEALLAVRRDVGPAFHERIVGWLRRAGVDGYPAEAASTSMSLVALVSAGVGIGFVTAAVGRLALAGVRYVPLVDSPTLGYALCHRHDLPTALRDSLLAAAARGLPP